MVYTNDIENYTGFSMIDGNTLTQKFQDHIATLSEFLTLEAGIEAASIEKNITSFLVTDTKGKHYYSRAVIIASGRKPRHLGIIGEDKFYGKGVAICATCDAPLYKNKNVAVVGGGNSALDALFALTGFAKRIYSININRTLSGDDIIKQKVMAASNITFLNQTKARAVVGDQRVVGLEVQYMEGKVETLAVDGVFVEIGWDPETSFDTMTIKDKSGTIKVDKDLQTNVPGLFAAGDVNDAWGEQIIIAAGEGAKAALAVADFLAKNK
jgi:NADH-dependent peroxiredoxin subunit F